MAPTKPLPKRVRQGRSGRPWDRMRAQVFAEEATCCWCGGYVDQRLPPTHPMSRTVDHVVALAKGGDPLKRSNLRLMHRKCNSIRANKERKRPWVKPVPMSVDVNSI
jgi:5-methylcytosine-specific restriction endonuclease McrA